MEASCLFILRRLPSDGWLTFQILRFYSYTQRLLTSAGEIQVIMSHVKNAQSLIVFGLGRDSSLWAAVGPEEIVFLEDNPQWIEKNNKLRDKIVLVSYGTKRREYLDLLDNEDKLQLDLPAEILNKSWDVVLVDAPSGYADHVPGRMKSIYMASRLVHQEGTVIVHDINREVEQVYAKKYLGQCIQLFERLGVFKHAPLK